MVIMKKILSLCMVIALLLCCFAGCQPQEKPLTEEEKALKELQDAWNAIFVEKTEEIKVVRWHKATFDSVIWRNTNPDDIAQILQIFAQVDIEKFQSGESKSVISSTMLEFGISYEEEPNTYRMDLRLRIGVMANNMLYVDLWSGVDNDNEPILTACCTDDSVQYDELMEQLEEMDFEA